MKRFFDLSTLLLIPFLILSIFPASQDHNTTTPVISEQAKEIYARVQGQIDVTLEDIQEGLDMTESTHTVTVMDDICNLTCHPLPGCCYGQGHLDRLISVFGCCPSTESCQYACLDLNGDGCINVGDLLILTSNYCGS